MIRSCCPSWWLQGNNCWKLHVNLIEEYLMEKKELGKISCVCLCVCICDTEVGNLLRPSYPFWIEFKLLLQILFLFGRVQSWWPKLYGNYGILHLMKLGKKKTFKHTGLSSGLTLIKKKRSYRSFCGLDKHSETSTDFLFFIFILHFE